MIHIMARHRPYSIMPGESCLIPYSVYYVRAFPTRLEIGRICDSKEPIVIEIYSQKEVSNFYIAQDLFEQKVRISGDDRKPLFTIDLFHDNGTLVMENQGKMALTYAMGDQEHNLLPKQTHNLIDVEEEAPTGVHEKLFLGKTKRLDWNMVKRRGDLRESFPILFLLGQMTPESKPLDDISLDDEEAFRRLISAHLSSINHPVANDPLYQGFSVDALAQHKDVTDILPLLYRSIRKVFLQEEGDRVRILPNLFRLFDRGKMTQVEFGGLHFSFEWSKRRLKRMEIYATKDMELPFLFPKEIKNFRMRSKSQSKGVVYTPDKMPTLKANTSYMLDRFRR